MNKTQVSQQTSYPSEIEIHTLSMTNLTFYVNAINLGILCILLSTSKGPVSHTHIVLICLYNNTK